MPEYVTTSKGRRYPFLSNGPLRVIITDEASTYLRFLADTFPREFASALKSTGYQLRKDLQTDIYKGGPSESRWKPLSDIHARRTIDDAKKTPRVPRTHPMGNLVRAVGYKYDAATQSVRVGWLSHSAAKLGSMLQQGFATRVTPKMRRFFWALDIPLAKSTTVLRSPSRDLFSTVLRHRERAILQHIEDKVHAKVNAKAGRFAWAA